MRYLLDTDTCSYLRDGQFPKVRQRALGPLSDIGVSVITRAELRFGVELKQSGKLDRLVTGFLAEFKSLSWTASSADVHAAIRARLQKSGAPIGGIDTVIASHAIALTLVWSVTI